MIDYFSFFKSLIIISIIAGALALAATDPKKHRTIRILLLITAGILLIAGLGGYFLMSISNVGSYRY
ncbi:hypothetical protein [Chryseobacterium sp. 3008163]|uniref:hypothetical protein n=1 Tax=Chryseobacterium sp. 3008163 TaxID=2478663 RepID=UPI001013D032|nr:hypothetical protein [Chryseobacterium sp. 3008163]